MINQVAYFECENKAVCVAGWQFFGGDLLQFIGKHK